MTKYSITVLFLTAIFYGCSSSVVIKPDYDREILKKNVISDKTNKKVTKVLDVRETKPTLAGTAQVGLFNKLVPYYIEDTVSHFVEHAVNKIIFNDSVKQFIPINVVIDSFTVYEKTTMFSEKGNFDCFLRFYYPVKKDSVVFIATSTHLERSGLDVTNSLENLIYEGVVECTKQFYEKFKINPTEYSFTDSEIPVEVNITSVIKNTIPKDSSKSEKAPSSNNIGMTILIGSKIKTGFQLAYQEYNKFKNPHFAGGFGYCGSYYDIENKKALMEGSFFSFNYRYSLRYFFSESHKGPYLSGGIKLSFGTESIDYGLGNKTTNFFIGPTLEEVLGISIAEKVFLEGGIFQIKHFGSDLMPDDFGYLFGLYVGI